MGGLKPLDFLSKEFLSHILAVIGTRRVVYPRKDHSVPGHTEARVPVRFLPHRRFRKWKQVRRQHHNTDSEGAGIRG